MLRNIKHYTDIDCLYRAIGDILHSCAHHILSEAENENYFSNPMRVEGVIFDCRGQYLECTVCNKSRHYLIQADDICFVTSSSEMLQPH